MTSGKWEEDAACTLPEKEPGEKRAESSMKQKNLRGTKNLRGRISLCKRGRLLLREKVEGDKMASRTLSFEKEWGNLRVFCK